MRAGVPRLTVISGVIGAGLALGFVWRTWGVPVEPAATPLRGAGYTSERFFLKSVVTKVRPEYPPEDIQSGVTGVVVVEIQLSSDGRVFRTQVLEAPSSSIAVAANKALEQWKFRPWWPANYIMASTVTMYFTKEDQQFRVRFPEEAHPLEPTRTSVTGRVQTNPNQRFASATVKRREYAD